MTSVVVRSSANNSAGAKSKMSAIHGVLLLISVLVPVILNKIPLATLATILILVGYKLAKPATFIHFWQKENINLFLYCYLVAVNDLLKGSFKGI
jgi:MFS superfamily sulfate permease-like transporter